jgi:glycosyltransferase involved in cell wall biosynthesis
VRRSSLAADAPSERFLPAGVARRIHHRVSDRTRQNGDDTQSTLKRELDTALTENQLLHQRLRRFDELPFVLFTLARLVRGQLRARRLDRLRLRASADEAIFAMPRDFAPSFRPYEVKEATAGIDRPRVLHAIGNFYTGGAARLVVDLVERLGDRFEQVTVVRDSPPQPHYVGCEIRSAAGMRSAREALRLIESLRPDLIHVHFLAHHRHPYSQADWEWYDGLFQAAARYGCPVVENVDVPVAPYFSDAVRRYVFVSDYVRTLFGRETDPNVTIYPGSNFELFEPREDAAPATGCIGMVYRLEKDKLDEMVIEIFIEVLRRRPEARALIVGGGRLLETYRARVEQAGLARSVTFTGYVAYDDLPQMYEQMSIFVAPAHWESFGHVVPLAMNMRIPVAAYAVGALPEIVGGDAVLAPAGDVDALASKIVELLDDRERCLRIGAASRERARRLFSVEKMAHDYRALYDELLV